MPDAHIVPVAKAVKLKIVSARNDPATCARLKLLARPVRVEQLFASKYDLSDTVGRRGLTDEILEEELAAHNAERRTPPRDRAWRVDARQCGDRFGQRSGQSAASLPATA